MRKLLIVLGAAALLAGCAENGEYYGFGLAGGYNAYYDDYYGPFYGGYWGPDRVFRYRPGPGRPFVRDESHHFHDRPNAGFHGVHAGRAPRGGPDHGGAGDRGDHPRPR